MADAVYDLAYGLANRALKYSTSGEEAVEVLGIAAGIIRIANLGRSLLSRAAVHAPQDKPEPLGPLAEHPGDPVGIPVRQTPVAP